MRTARLLSGLLLLCLLLMPGCRAQSDITVVKLGHGLDPSHPVHQAMVFMAERVVE